MPSNELLTLREAVNVPDALQRDKLVRRIKRLRASVVLDVNTIEHWNRTHPNEMPVSTDFERAVIAWCDGKGPFPELPEDASHVE